MTITAQDFLDQIDEVSDEEKQRRKEERAEAIALSKDLKKKFQKDWGAKVKARVIASAKNPFIEFRVSSPDTIPNDLRLKLVRAMGSEPRDTENVNYGNIMPNSITLHFSEWKKMQEKGIV